MKNGHPVPFGSSPLTGDKGRIDHVFLRIPPLSSSLKIHVREANVSAVHLLKMERAPSTTVTLGTLNIEGATTPTYEGLNISTSIEPTAQRLARDEQSSVRY